MTMDHGKTRGLNFRNVAIIVKHSLGVNKF